MQTMEKLGVRIGQLYQQTDTSDSDSRTLNLDEEEVSRWTKRLYKLLGFMTKYELILLVNLSIALSVLTTWTLETMRPSFTRIQVQCMNAIGMMYLNALHSILIPIIASSVIVSMARLDVRFLGSIGLCTLFYFTCTTCLAVMLGIVLVQTVKPGIKKGARRIDVDISGGTTEDYIDTLLDMFRSIFPSSLVEVALFYPQAVFDEYKQQKADIDLYDEDEGPSDVDRDFGKCWKATNTEYYCRGTNYPGMVVCSLTVGIALGFIRFKFKYEIFVLIFKSLNDALLRIVHCLVWISPIGIYFLIVSKMVNFEEVSGLIGHLMKFVFTVIFGVCFHTFVTLPTIYIAITHKMPFRVYFNLIDAMVAAFATSSSVATMPHTLYCMEMKNHISPVVTRFVIPLGATINMDGSALYEAVAPIFIAQLNQAHLSYSQVISIRFDAAEHTAVTSVLLFKLAVTSEVMTLQSIGATLASLGTSGVPQAGLLNMMIALRMLKLPEADVGLILAVDWFLDRFRTAANVTSDAICSAVVYHLCKNQIHSAGLDVSESKDDVIVQLFEAH